jgi:hypothetical protein
MSTGLESESRKSTLSPAKRHGIVYAGLLLIATLLAVVVIRVRLSSMPLERDEGEYAYFGQLMLDGVMPYQGAYNMKWPGTYASYAAIMAVLGQSAVAIRAGLIVVNLITACLVYQIARRCTDVAGGCIAASTYAILSISPSLAGLAAHATHFVMLPALLAVWLVQSPDSHRHLSRLFLAGAAVGTAAVMKQSGAAFLGFVLWWVWLIGYREKAGCRKIAIRLADVVAGFVIPVGIMFAIIAASGAFARFWFWTWDYAGAYATLTPIPRGIIYLQESLWGLVRAAPILGTLAGFGLAMLLLPLRPQKDRAFVLGFFAFSFLAVCPGLYFSANYLIQLVPAIALLVSAGVLAGRRLVGPSVRLSRLASMFAVFAGAGAAQALLLHQEIYFLQTPQAVSRTIYGFNPFPEAEVIGRFLAARCPKNARIAIIGSEPEIYFYAQRRAVTGYLYLYPMTERQPYARQMQREFMAEIEQGAPDYVIFVDAICSWYSNSPIGTEGQLMSWFKGYEQRNLTLIGLAEIGDQTTQYRWSFDTPRVPLPASNSLAVYRRLSPAERVPARLGKAEDKLRRPQTTIAW